MSTYQEKLERIFRISLQVSDVKDIDVLMERILTEARNLVNADAGSIYIKEGDDLKFSYTQNEQLRRRLGPNRKLPFETFKIPISHRSIAGHAAASGEIINLANVYDLPPGVPFSFDQTFDKLSNYKTQSVLTIPLKDNRAETIGVLQLINAQNRAGEIVAFEEADIDLFKHFANNAAIAIERAKMTRMTIMRMIKMAEMHDPYETGAHAHRVASYAVEIFEAWALRQKMPQKEIDRVKDILMIASILHDVGKIAIPDAILKKPGKLTDEEFASMRAHTYLGARLFSDSGAELDQAAAMVALNHHERWDGTGYPGHVDPETGEPLEGFALPNGRARGKKEEEIPLFGRIVAIADVYDALLSRRTYKAAWDEEEVVNEIIQGSGRHFDPELVEAFASTLDSIRSIARRFDK